ncbi:indolepyruvate oxidoreductase [Desulfosarcina ovata subsp. sediminis]|uniref:Indolepyruvate oxidoreductase n=1 Tax=Desulfosarcina ovata subsp. sediminis TaxID=885957 RepID=A0A5K7ZI52_9BACT|nr:indolepyruvate oxidoreductase subunit beta [Desulfosarcina ovata]BBO81034.1 indolepyruvate oxidoreductase [Desulfosarcina ovata subsp. sediminis]
MNRETNNTTNVLVVGTGGQGVITASEIMSDVAMLSGFDTKKSEIHGMSQRGGVVTSHVRYSEKVYSPTIMEGEADILLSFELAETVRWMHYLKPDGHVITSLQRIIPPAVYAGMGSYPDNAEMVIRQGVSHSILVDALLMAEDLGNPRLVNTILLGVASTLLDLPVDGWESVIADRVPPKFKELNLVAFDRGRNFN